MKRDGEGVKIDMLRIISYISRLAAVVVMVGRDRYGVGRLVRPLCGWIVADEREKNEKLHVKNVKKGLISCQFPIILLTLRGKVGMCAYGF